MFKIEYMKGKTFFMVFMEYGHTPTFKHETYESACNEAQRLSRLHKKKTWVLCTLKSYEIVEFHEKDCRPEIEDLPF